MASIASTLGIGSGIDTKALVEQLVAAQRDTKTTSIKTRSDKVTAQITGLASLKSGLANFTTALSTLVAGGSLSTQPTSADTTVVKVATISGVPLGALSTSVEVRQLASTQALSGPSFASGDAPVGTGKLTFTFGKATVAGNAFTGFAAGTVPAPVDVTIDSTNNSLAGIARAINEKNAGLTASVITDGAGARLVIKGPSGEASAFTVAATEDVGAPGLAALNFGVGASGMTLSQQAKDAIVAIDGITVQRSTNTIADLIDGVRLDLQSAAVGKPIAIGSARPTENLKAAVNDFVGAYNELRAIVKEQSDPTTGTLGSDVGVRQMQRMLSTITSTALRASGSPKTLAEIGVKTNRDGTLAVDSAALEKALAADPAAIEAMFNPGQSSSNPLVKIISPVGGAKAGSYAVTDLIPATSGNLTGVAAPTAFATALLLDSTNNRFVVSIDGGDAIEVRVAEGSFANGAAFAAALASAIEAEPLILTRGSVEWANDQLVMRSRSLGASSSIAMAAVDATVGTRLGLVGATLAAGADASGKIAGIAATASGSLLFAAAGSPASGLVLQPLAGATSATIGVDLGLAAALKAINQQLTSTQGGSLYSSTTRLEKQKVTLTADQAKVDADAEKLEERLTKQFASMDARVAAYKSTQSFLEQQIDIWTNPDN